MKVAVTGASGFIGSQVRIALRRTGASLRVMSRAPIPHSQDVEVVVGDIRGRGSLLELVNGVDAVVHAASYIGEHPALQVDVNVRGTELLIEAARSAGVVNVVYISTAGVYGGTFSHGGAEGQIQVAPRSSLSSSRRAAELVVEGAGGAVLRPNMVLGDGDRWFLHPLLRLMDRMDLWIEGGRPRVSVIDAPTLGSAAAALAVMSSAQPGVYHAALPRPVPIRSLVGKVFDHVGRCTPARSVSEQEVGDLLRPHGVSQSALSVVSRDNWFDSGKLWRTIAGSPTEDGLFDAAALRWYSTALAPPDAQTD